MKDGKVFYRVGLGWCYTLRGVGRSGFETAEAAGLEMRRESFYLRSVRRAENREPLTFGDKVAEGLFLPVEVGAK